MGQVTRFAIFGLARRCGKKNRKVLTMSMSVRRVDTLVGTLVVLFVMSSFKVTIYDYICNYFKV